jgi:hypothetical protein
MWRDVGLEVLSEGSTISRHSYHVVFLVSGCEVDWLCGGLLEINDDGKVVGFDGAKVQMEAGEGPYHHQIQH